MSHRLRIDAKPRLLIAAAGASFALAAAAVLLCTIVPSLLSPLAAALLVLALAAIGAVEILFWSWRGIRCLEIDADALLVRRGRALKAVTVTRSSTRWSPRAVKVVRRFGRRVLVLRPRGDRRITVAEDTFGREEFTRLLETLDSWRRG